MNFEDSTNDTQIAAASSSIARSPSLSISLSIIATSRTCFKRLMLTSLSGRCSFLHLVLSDIRGHLANFGEHNCRCERDDLDCLGLRIRAWQRPATSDMVMELWQLKPKFEIRHTSGG